MSLARHLGRGPGFPLHPRARDGGAGLDYVEGEAKVREALQLLLDTEPGERVMRPTFGCGLRRHLMKPNTTAVRALIRHDVEAALKTWEPRIDLKTVQVVPSDEEPSRVDIHIGFAFARDKRPGSFVYPFYLE